MLRDSRDSVGVRREAWGGQVGEGLGAGGVGGEGLGAGRGGW